MHMITSSVSSLMVLVSWDCGKSRNLFWCFIIGFADSVMSKWFSTHRTRNHMESYTSANRRILVSKQSFQSNSRSEA